MQFNQLLDKEFTPLENALINFVFFYSPGHVYYFDSYVKGHFEKCLAYLVRNRKLLTFNNLPPEPETKRIAKVFLKVAKEFYALPGFKRNLAGFQIIAIEDLIAHLPEHKRPAGTSQIFYFLESEKIPVLMKHEFLIYNKKHVNKSIENELLNSDYNPNINSIFKYSFPVNYN